MANHAVANETQPARRAWQAARDSAAWARGYLWRAAVGDFACALIAGPLAVVARFVDRGYLPIPYLDFTFALPFLWVASISLAGGYETRFIGMGSDEFRRVAKAALMLTAGVAVLSYALDLDISRGYVALAMPLTGAFDLGMRYMLRKHLHRMRRLGRYVRRVLVAGHAPAVAELAASLRRSTYHGMSLVGACLADVSAPEVAGIPVFGGLDSITAALDHFGADAVAVLACPEMNGARLRELAWELERTSTELYVASALLDIAGPRTTIRPIAGLPVLHLDQPELRGIRRISKETIDRFAAGVALLLLAPAFLIIGLLIRIGDGGPVFFRQARIGKDGETFPLWKFRTMVVDAETRLAELSELNEAAGVLFKMRHDPRVTKAGAWLRRWSVDELPQLINVLRGDMSLIGPRPPLPQEAAQYGNDMRRRLKVKPGITGLWQVSGRADLPWDEAIRLDMYYVENWSVALDINILWRTWVAILRRDGAY